MFRLSLADGHLTAVPNACRLLNFCGRTNEHQMDHHWAFELRALLFGTGCNSAAWGARCCSIKYCEPSLFGPENQGSKGQQAISLHTFFVIFSHWKSKSWLIPTAVNLLLWTYLVRNTFLPFLSRTNGSRQTLLVVIGWVVHQSSGNNFFSPTPYWCWIDKKFLVERLIGKPGLFRKLSSLKLFCR